MESGLVLGLGRVGVGVAWVGSEAFSVRALDFLGLGCGFGMRRRRRGLT